MAARAVFQAAALAIWCLWSFSRLWVAVISRHPQPTEAPQAPDSQRSGLKDGPGGHRPAGQHLRPEQHTSVGAIAATNVATTVAASLCATSTVLSDSVGPGS